MQRLDQLTEVIQLLRSDNARLMDSNNAMLREIKILSMTNVLLIRGVYNKQAPTAELATSAAGLLTELGYQNQIPQ